LPGKDWFRDLDSNQDTQLQRLMSYRLDDPGIDSGIVAEPSEGSQVRSAGQFTGNLLPRCHVEFSVRTHP
jgi:hypothetical protein